MRAQPTPGQSRPPTKLQDILIKVGYRLEPEDNEALESKQIKAAVKTSVGTFRGSARADGPSGAVSIPITGVKNLSELEVISASVAIEDGNRLEGEATVPRDPLMGIPESVGVQCDYQSTLSKSGQSIFRVTATVYLVKAVSGMVAGSVRVLGGKGKSVPISFANGATVATAALGDLHLKPGSVVEVEATLTRNGMGTAVGAATAEKEEDVLTGFALDVVRKTKATASGYANFEIMGEVQADLPYVDRQVDWTVQGQTGTTTVSKNSGAGTFLCGGMPLKPGSLVEGRVKLKGGGELTASASVPDDEPNSLVFVRLTGTPDDPKNLNGNHTLELAVSGIAPRGEGAEVSLSGPVDVSVISLDGHGGNHEVVVVSSRQFPPGQPVVVAVTIDGGNMMTAEWPGPPPLPVEEKGVPEEEIESEPEESSDDDSRSPAPVGGGGSSSSSEGGNDDSEENEDEEEEVLEIELIHPRKETIKEGIHWIRLRVTREDGAAALGSMISVEIPEGANGGEGLAGRIVTTQPLLVGEEGFADFQYQTGNFATLPGDHSLMEQFVVYQETGITGGNFKNE